MKIKIALMIPVLAAVIAASSCVQAPPSSAADELPLHGWYLPSQQARLSFCDGILILSRDTDGAGPVIKGRYFTDGSTITVLSESAGTVKMTYSLVNDRLELTYSGRTAEFVKDNNFID